VPYFSGLINSERVSIILSRYQTQGLVLGLSVTPLIKSCCTSGAASEWLSVTLVLLPDSCRVCYYCQCYSSYLVDADQEGL